VTVLQTIAIFAVIPLALYGLLSLLTLWPKLSRAPRYRPGQPWNHEPVWWTGNPKGIGQEHEEHARPAITAGDDISPPVVASGGARGNW
jgi:hypothetical protein